MVLALCVHNTHLSHPLSVPVFPFLLNRAAPNVVWAQPSSSAALTHVFAKDHRGAVAPPPLPLAQRSRCQTVVRQSMHGVDDSRGDARGKRPWHG